MTANQWASLAVKLPNVIRGTVAIVQHIKGAKGSDKKDAVLAAIPDAVVLSEYAVSKDLLNDASIQALIGAYVDAEAAALKAKAALHDGILAKQA